MRIGQTSFVSFLSQFLSSVIGFLATVYITRSLGSAVFGEYMLVIALVIWLQVIGVLGIENAVTKRLSESGPSSGTFTAGVALVLAAFTLLSVAVLVFADQINNYVGASVAIYIPLLLFAGMGFKFIAAALRGQHKVHLASLLRPFDRTLRSAIQIVVLFVGFGLVGLLAGYIVAGIVTSAVGLYYLSVSLKRPGGEDFRSIVSFAQYAWLGRLGSRTFSSMDTIVLGFFVSSSFIGYYEVAWNLASILAIFGVAIAQTLFPEVSRTASEGDQEQVGSLITDSLSYTGLFLIPGLVGSYLIGDLVLRIYGNEFQQAMTVLVLLVSARLVYEYGNQLINGLNGIDRPDLAFRLNLVFVIVNVGLNVALVALYGWIGAAVATLLSAVLTFVLAYHLFTQLITITVPLVEIRNQVLAALGMGAVVYVGRLLLPERVLAGVALVAVGGAAYLLFLAAISEDFRTTVRRNLPLDV